MNAGEYAEALIAALEKELGAPMEENYKKVIREMPPEYLFAGERREMARRLFFENAATCWTGTGRAGETDWDVTENRLRDMARVCRLSAEIFHER